MSTFVQDQMYQPPKVVLLPEHQTLCLKTLRFLSDLGPEIEKLRNAGLDVTAWEQLRSRLTDIFQNVAKDFCSQNLPV